jgi:hypothetical protein
MVTTHHWGISFWRIFVTWGQKIWKFHPTFQTTKLVLKFYKKKKIAPHSSYITEWEK